MLELFLSLLTTPAIVLGLVALIGLLLQKKSGDQVFLGTLKTVLGLLILSAGAGLIVTHLAPFSELFAQVFNLTGLVPFDEAVVGALQANVPVIARTSAVIMAAGFLVNIALARFTPLKYIFLTGHMMWILSVVLAFVLYESGYSETIIMVVGAILQGTFLTLLPAISQPIMRKLTGNNAIGYGHLTTIGVVSSAYVGKVFGDSSKSSEELKLPENLKFFKDTAASVAIVMGIFYILLVIIAGPTKTAAFAGDQNFLVWGLLGALGFTAGILILLQGVRMFLGELVPSFKGIADKLVPGAIPALDCPAIFGFAPTALMIGFITSVIGMAIGMVVSGLIFGIVPLISIIGGFFTGGSAGIMGNAAGGRRGAAIAGFIYGLWLTIPVAATYNIFDLPQYGVTGTALLVSDVLVALPLFKIPFIGIGVLVAIFVIYSFMEVRYKKSLSK